MKLPFWIARRYIVSKKSTNAISIISGISVFGISLGSMALIIIMSVFNGFEEVLQQLISAFKPDMQITAKVGKTFTLSEEQVQAIQNTPGISFISSTLEEVALFEYGASHALARLKGVDNHFTDVVGLDSMLIGGTFKIKSQATNFAVIGAAFQNSLDVVPDRADNRPLVVFMPRREAKKLSNTSQPFRQRDLYPAGVYTVEQLEYDNHVITNLDFVRELLAYEDGEISALEIKLEPNANVYKIKTALYNILPESDFSIKDRYEQDEAFFKVTNMEKWVGFIIFAFTLVLVAFNMIGALWMLVLEKQKDIATLKALGADNNLIRNIFLTQGTLLSAIGVFSGVILGLIVCLLQQYTGFIKLDTGTSGTAFIVDYYPVALRLSDFIIVIGTVLLIGTIASWIPANRAAKVEGIVRNE